MTEAQAYWFTAAIAVGIPILAVVIYIVIETHKNNEMKKEEVAKLKKKLAKVEDELEKLYGCSPLTDGFGTMRYAKKSRKLDYLAMERTELRNRIEDAENEKI